MTTQEYKTTLGTYSTEGRSIGGDWRDGDASDPHAPSGEGWRMAGAAAADGMLFWFWVRPVPAVTGEQR
jgi:hypothetical protein